MASVTASTPGVCPSDARPSRTTEAFCAGETRQQITVVHVRTTATNSSSVVEYDTPPMFAAGVACAPSARKPREQRYAEGQAARGHVFEDYVRHLFRRHGQALLDPQPDLLETDLQVPAVELWSRWIGKP